VSYLQKILALNFHTNGNVNIYSECILIRYQIANAVRHMKQTVHLLTFYFPLQDRVADYRAVDGRRCLIVVSGWQDRDGQSRLSMLRMLIPLQDHLHAHLQLTNEHSEL